MASVLITGASRGIGAATALELARAGHTVFATMRDPQGCPEMGETAEREGLPLHVSRMDIDSDASVRDGVAAIESSHGPVDVLVNNAGIGRKGTIEELDMEDFQVVMNTNYLGTIRCIKAVLPSMRARASGCIVNVSSIAGRVAFPIFCAYTASKFALEAMSEILAQEMAAHGIRVAVVEPGIIDTELAQSVTDEDPSRYPHGARIASIFRAALSQHVPPSVVGKVIRGIVEGDATGLRHPAGPDAAPMIAWRAAVNDEDWVAWWGVADDDAWYAQCERDLDMDLRAMA